MGIVCYNNFGQYTVNASGVGYGYRVVDVQVEACGIQLAAGIDIGSQFVVPDVVGHAAVLRQSVFGAVHNCRVHVAHYLFGGAVHDIRLHDEPAVGRAVIAGNGYRVVYNQFVAHYFPGYGPGLRVWVFCHNFHLLKSDAAVDVGVYLLFVIHFAQFVFHLHVKD